MQQNEKITHKDVYIEKIKDTTIYVEIDRYIQQTANKFSTDTSVLENKFAKSVAWISDSILNHVLEQKEQLLATKIQYVDKYHYLSKDSLIQKTNIVEVNKLTRVQNIKIVLGNIFSCLLALACLYSIYRGYKWLH